MNDRWPHDPDFTPLYNYEPVKPPDRQARPHDPNFTPVYNHRPGQMPPWGPPPQPPGNGMAIAALVTGIVALLVSFFGMVGVPLAIVGIVLGIAARKGSSQSNGMATGGLVCSIVALVISGVALAACMACISSEAYADACIDFCVDLGCAVCAGYLSNADLQACGDCLAMCAECGEFLQFCGEALQICGECIACLNSC